MRATLGTRAICPHCGCGLQVEVLEAGLVRVNNLGVADGLVFNLWNTEFFRVVMWVRGNGIVEDVDLQPKAMSEFELRRRVGSFPGLWRPFQAEEDAAMVQGRESSVPWSRHKEGSGNIF